MGYDNILETGAAETASDKLETAHKDVVDKLLADYYLGMRGEYAESNKLMKQLTEVFEKEKEKESQDPHRLRDKGFN